MAQFSNGFQRSLGRQLHGFTLIIHKPRTKITIIVYSPLRTGTESELWKIYFTRSSMREPFAKHNNRKCDTQQKSAQLSVSLSLFVGDFVRIPRYPKNFQSKNVFLSSTKSGSTQTQTRNEIVFEYFVWKYRRRKIVASRSFRTLATFHLPLI